jgi:hypothetical protein
MSVCDHAGFHSGQGRYTPETAQLRYVLVCDDCDSELCVLESVDYRPEPQLEPATPAR